MEMSIRYRTEMSKTADRLGREDWADAALDAIGRGGVVAVAVEPIAAALGVTKGSFYWHFANRRELVDAALERWALSATAEVIENLAPIDDPTERLRALFRVAFRNGDQDRIEDAILATTGDDAVLAVIANVNRTRLAYLEVLFAQLGLSPSAARSRARAAYATLLGHRALQRSTPTQLTDRATRTFVNDLVATLTSV
jgi:AcrR family transcriptional regulator